MTRPDFDQRIPIARYPASRWLVWIAVICLCALGSKADATVTYSFSGDTSMAIGSIPGNTPFTGTFTYNPSAAGVSTSYYGGTETLFANAYSGLTVTIGGSTVRETVPGTIALFNGVNPPFSVPPGDSLFSFDPLSGAGPNPSTGEFVSYGLTPDLLYLALSDSTGTAFSGTNLPSVLNLSAFNSAIMGIDYGPEGAGNTDVVSNISTLRAVPDESYTAWLMLFALGGMAGMKWIWARQGLGG
jgi:hypothetical protein